MRRIASAALTMALVSPVQANIDTKGNGSTWPQYYSCQDDSVVERVQLQNHA